MKRIFIHLTLASVLGALIGCTTPGATEIPVESQPAEVEPATRPVESQPTTAATVETPAEPEIPVEALDFNGVNGGKAIYELDGTPEQVLEMLLDFDHADGHRAWAEKHTNKRVNGDETTVHWHFHGKAGVDPDCDIVFTTLRRKSDIVLRFKQKEGVFGLAAFFGDYRLQSAGPQKTKVTARVYAASGILIADASHDDLASGLREDAKLTREWMRIR